MDELRWLLIILGALVIVAIYLHGTIQNWRHDGPPWSRRRRDHREPFAEHGLREPRVDDGLDDPEPRVGHDEPEETLDDERLSPYTDSDAAAEPDGYRESPEPRPDEDDPDDDFPAWARSRAAETRSPAEDWPMPDLEARTEREHAPSQWHRDDEPAPQEQQHGEHGDITAGAQAAAPEAHGSSRWSPARVSERLRRALGVTDSHDDGQHESRGEDGAGDPVDVPPGMPEKIVVINVMAPDDERFQGHAVFDALHRAGLTHGEHSIFHHYVESARGPVSEFSAANILNPGWFDLERMGEVETPGLAFFLRLPGPFDPAKAFEGMLAAGRSVAGELQGHLLDARRCDLTQQTIEHLREEMVEYRRRTQLAARQSRP